MHDMNNTNIVVVYSITNSARVPPLDSVNTAPELPYAEHQNGEQFENTPRAAVSLLIDTKFQYTERSSFRKRLLVRLLQTTMALVKSVALKVSATAVGNEDLGYGVSAALHFNTQCSITKKNWKDQ
jgi:hypothetical protein